MNIEGRKTLRFSCFLLGLLMVLGFGGEALGVTKDYGNYTLRPWWKFVMPDTWDLTAGDMTIEATLDLSKITSSGWNVLELGIVGKGEANWDKGLYLHTRFADPDSGTNPNSFDMDDFCALVRNGAGQPVQEYDTVDPDVVDGDYGSNDSFNVWFDRDGVDSTQAQPGNLWGWSDGGNWNTGGIYGVKIRLHAISSTLGTAFVTINGYGQGIRTVTSPDRSQQPDKYPAGVSFTASDLHASDLSQLEIYLGQGAQTLDPGESSQVRDLRVTQVPEPMTMLAFGSAVAGLGGYIRRRRRA